MSLYKMEFSKEIFQKKPYLQKYFQKKTLLPPPYSLLISKKEEAYYVTYNEKPISSPFAPKEAAIRLLQSSPGTSKDLIFVFGLGNPELLTQSIEIYAQNTIILYVDHDIEILPILWEKILEPILEIPGRHLFVGEEMTPYLFNYLDSLSFEKIRGVKFYKNPASIQLNPKFYDELEKKITAIFSSKMSDLLTKFEFEKIWIKNSVLNTCNFSNLPRRHKIASLQNQFSGIPALLVSAGPSLRNTLDAILPFRDSLFVMSCDTSYKVLTKFGIVPDAAMTLDAQTNSFFHFMGEDYSQTPIFADLVSSPLLLRRIPSVGIVHSITAKFSVMADGKWEKTITSGGEIAEMHYGNLGYIQSGGSVATTAFDALRFMGFSPIFFIGQDLAYTGREIHSTGTHHNEKWLTKLSRTSSLEKINEAIIRKRETKFVKSSETETVLTDFVLDLYRQWFQDSANSVEFPLYNIQEKGAYLEGFQNISKLEVPKFLSGFPNHSYPWKNLDPWKQLETNTKTENQTVNREEKQKSAEIKQQIRSYFEKIDSAISEFENSEELNSETILKQLREIPVFSNLLRKVEVYLIRKASEFEPSMKKEILLRSLKTEFTSLKKGLYPILFE